MSKLFNNAKDVKDCADDIAQAMLREFEPRRVVQLFSAGNVSCSTTVTMFRDILAYYPRIRDIVGDMEIKERAVFRRLVSHYVFKHHVCTRFRGCYMPNKATIGTLHEGRLPPLPDPNKASIGTLRERGLPPLPDLYKVLPTFTPHKDKEDMKISRPVLIGNVDILTASDEQLTNIIRTAKQRIKDDADMAEISEKFAQKAKELNKVINLCIEQLDKDSSES